MSSHEIQPVSVDLPRVDDAFTALLIGGGKSYGFGTNWPEQGNLLDAGLELTGKQQPDVLLVASARWITESGVNKVTDRFIDYYAGRGATATTLHPFLYNPHDFKEPDFTDVPIDPARLPSQSELQDKIEAADLIFVLGGDTHRMINQVWKPNNIDTMLVNAVKRGAVMSGTSAGTIAWFKGGPSDSSSKKAETPGNNQQLHYVEALGLIEATIACPHYDALAKDLSGVAHARKKSFAQIMSNRRNLQELGLGIEDNAALQITNGGLIQVIRGGGTGTRNVHARHYRRGKLEKTVLTPADGGFRLHELVA